MNTISFWKWALLTLKCFHNTAILYSCKTVFNWHIRTTSFNNDDAGRLFKKKNWVSFALIFQFNRSIIDHTVSKFTNKTLKNADLEASSISESCPGYHAWPSCKGKLQTLTDIIFDCNNITFTLLSDSVNLKSGEFCVGTRGKIKLTEQNGYYESKKMSSEYKNIFCKHHQILKLHYIILDFPNTMIRD